MQERLGLDTKDVRILAQFMKDPETSQAHLAQKLKISQPSVNARVQKLKKRGILANSMGINLDRNDLYLARVDFTAKNAHHMLETLADCPFFVNGFIMSGLHNVSILIVESDLRKIESIIEKHLRANADVKNIEMNVVVQTTKPLIYSADLERELHESCQNRGSCEGCQLH